MLTCVIGTPRRILSDDPNESKENCPNSNDIDALL